MSNTITYIDENECIGDSLDTINANFNVLNTQFTTAFHCETSGTGVLNQFMSFGGRATSQYGLAMPYRGQLLKASLQVFDATGTVAVQPAINNNTYSNYELSTTGTDLTSSQLSAYSTPLEFNEGDVLGWKQVSVPSSANAYNVTFVTKFYM